MGDIQTQRKAAARTPRAKARADGYLDGLYCIEGRREMHPPFERFAYDAGYLDGARAREELFYSDTKD